MRDRIYMSQEEAAIKFWGLVDQSGGPDDCWYWTRSPGNHGYGQVNWKAFGGGQGGIPTTAHRLAYELTYGPIPVDESGKTKYIDHTCHNNDLHCDGGSSCKHRLCCNPKHLEAIENRQNLDRANEARGRKEYSTHCPEGHPLEGDNLIEQVQKRKDKPPYVRRVCRHCKRDKEYLRKFGVERGVPFGEIKQRTQ